MQEKLEFTGERFTPECEREIWYEHIHRYALAAQWAPGKRILDAACGEGYGSALLSRGALSVSGVDVSEQVISHASHRYQKDNLKFSVADCTDLPFDADHFDMVVSFETLEHLVEQEEMLLEFRRVLKPGGFLVMSSPDRAVYSDQQGFTNEFHVRELYRAELEQLISLHFPAFRLLGQKLMFHSAIWDLGGVSKVGLQTAAEDGGIQNGQMVHAPMYFIALCAASEEFLPDTSGQLSLFDDRAESVYTHYHHEIRKNMEAGGILAERDAEIQSLKESLRQQGRKWWQRVTGKG